MLRRLLLGSGPLLRGTDRVQRVSRMFALVAVVAAIALAPSLAGAVHAHEAAVVSRQAAERTPVQARLVHEPVISSESAVAIDAGYAGSVPVHAPATWTAPQGTPRAGEVPAPAGTRAGQAVTIWVTRDGALTTAPLDQGAVLRDAVVVGVDAVLGISLVAGGLHLWVCRIIGRRRDRQWGAEWAAVEPVWRGQLL